MRSLEDTLGQAGRKGWACRRSRELVARAAWPPGACSPARAGGAGCGGRPQGTWSLHPERILTLAEAPVFPHILAPPVKSFFPFFWCDVENS